MAAIIMMKLNDLPLYKLYKEILYIQVLSKIDTKVKY